MITVGAVAAWVLVLGVVYGVKQADVNAARLARDEAQAEVTRLQGEVAELREFGELAQRLDAREALLAEAMSAEISYARLLNDLALSFPQTASLKTVAINRSGEDADGGDSGSADTDTSVVDFQDQAVASADFTGYSVEQFAPGIERMLLDFENVRSFFNTYLSTATDVERGNTEVTQFEASVNLTEEAYTDRYREGLPAQVRQ
jgi:Tfp pilus assembly protein PilN